MQLFSCKTKRPVTGKNPELWYMKVWNVALRASGAAFHAREGVQEVTETSSGGMGLLEAELAETLERALRAAYSRLARNEQNIRNEGNQFGDRKNHKMALEMIYEQGENINWLCIRGEIQGGRRFSTCKHLVVFLM